MTAAAPWSGTLAAIFLSPGAGKAMRSVDHVRAVPGRGLEGDRYFAGAGTYSRKAGRDREVTLIEEEAVHAAERDEGVHVDASMTRRNLLTRGVPLNHLVGREFRVGEVVLRGLRLCEPCAYMERLAGVPGARKALVHRGGLRAEIVTQGVLRVADAVLPA